MNTDKTAKLQALLDDLKKGYNPMSGEYVYWIQKVERSLPKLLRLCESVVEIDESLQEIESILSLEIIHNGLKNKMVRFAMEEAHEAQEKHQSLLQELFPPNV